MRKIDLTNKVALVTGGGQGLGAVTCKALVEAGANVIINYFDDEKGINKQRAEETAQELGNSAVPMKANVRNIDEIEEMLNSILSKYGKIDIVINNAGIVRDKTLKKMSTEEWQQVIDTNLTGVFNVCRSVVEKISDGGRIVNLSSISGILGFFGQSNYAASKAGVIGFTKVLSRELGRKGITVNAVAPGVILTEMGKSIPEEVRDEMLKNIPLNKFGDPEDIANTILFLCSDMAKYITSQVINVNGGWIG
ncbi:MAG: beta-ketoacyl-ACP reductase [Desulfobacteraceae bacterium 4572_35.1]|nr:MAG: beta-ketoacyl-ACP reductase [Desulfobacteraceae bacterium 4572_35.1]